MISHNMKKLFKMMFDPENKTPSTDQVMDFLILNGALEVAGIDQSTGEFLYTFTPKIKDIMPEVYNKHLNSVNSEIMKLWEKGFLNVDFLAEEPLVTLTQKAFDKEEISRLSHEDIWSLEEIKRLLKSKEL